MKKIFSRQSGQSLLEMIFAIGFLLMTISAILALTAANISGQKESEDQVIANNLARESIEAVRNIRDSNWLAKASWDSGLNCLFPNKCRTVLSQSHDAWSVDQPTDQSNAPFILYRSPDGVYSYNSAGNLPTIFSRHIFIYSICNDDNSGRPYIEKRSSCTTGRTKAGLQVLAVVGWQEKNRRRQVQIEDLLYAWK